MENQQQENYQQIYSNFIKKHKSGVQIDGEEVGAVIVELTQYFGERNLVLAAKENVFRAIAAQTINGADPTTGKPISAAKADVLIDATNEAQEYRLAKTHLEIISQYLMALRSLQKGILSEYANMGGT